MRMVPRPLRSAAGTDPATEGAPPAAAANGEEGMRMEGWLYLIRSNRFGLQYSRKRYFVLEELAFKSAPSSKREDFYIFTLYNASNHYNQLKLGARSSEAAARWIRCLMESALGPVRLDRFGWAGSSRLGCLDSLLVRSPAKCTPVCPHLRLKKVPFQPALA